MAANDRISEAIDMKNKAWHQKQLKSVTINEEA